MTYDREVVVFAKTSPSCDILIYDDWNGRRRRMGVGEDGHLKADEPDVDGEEPRRFCTLRLDDRTVQKLLDALLKAGHRPATKLVQFDDRELKKVERHLEDMRRLVFRDEWEQMGGNESDGGGSQL